MRFSPPAAMLARALHVRFVWGLPPIPHGFFSACDAVRHGTLACASRLRLRCSLAHFTCGSCGGCLPSPTVFLVPATRFDTEHSHALLASGCDARSRATRAVRVGAASHPPHPQRRTLTTRRRERLTSRSGSTSRNGSTSRSGYIERSEYQGDRPERARGAGTPPRNNLTTSQSTRRRGNTPQEQSHDGSVRLLTVRRHLCLLEHDVLTDLRVVLLQLELRGLSALVLGRVVSEAGSCRRHEADVFSHGGGPVPSRRFSGKAGRRTVAPTVNILSGRLCSEEPAEEARMRCLDGTGRAWLTPAGVARPSPSAPLNFESLGRRRPDGPLTESAKSQ